MVVEVEVFSCQKLPLPNNNSRTLAALWHRACRAALELGIPSPARIQPLQQCHVWALHLTLVVSPRWLALYLSPPFNLPPFLTLECSPVTTNTPSFAPQFSCRRHADHPVIVGQLANGPSGGHASAHAAAAIARGTTTAGSNSNSSNST